MNGGQRRLIWSPEAIADLGAIWDYYAATAGAKSADKLIRNIGDVVSVLEEHPHAGRRRDELQQGLRSISIAPHVVFYRVRNNVPEIVRVLDGRRDLDDIFSGSDAS